MIFLLVGHMLIDYKCGLKSCSFVTGGRTAQAVVDQAMAELKKIVNARMGGKSVSTVYIHVIY